MLWELFRTFLTIGFVSFGGGYAMIPVIGDQVEKHQWMTGQEFMDVTAVAGMSPGPIATNTAIFVGYKAAGLPGAIVSTLGMVLPSLIIVIVVATFFYKVYKHKNVKSAFYGLRAVITGLIFYGAIKFGLNSKMITLDITSYTVVVWIIFALSLFALLKLKTHPFYVIVLSGLVGMAVFS